MKRQQRIQAGNRRLQKWCVAWRCGLRQPMAWQHETSGQMAVELALLVPMIMVMVLVSLNLMCFIALSARFDRVSQVAVLAHGVSPGGASDAVSLDAAVLTALQDAMPDGVCELGVHSEAVTRLGTKDFSLLPSLRRYHCTMRFAPWPSSWVIAGFSLSAPVRLEHSHSLVVDTYKTGVVV